MRNVRFLRLLICSLLICSLSLVVAVAQDAPAPPKRGPSTPEERKRLVEIVRKVEKSPLDAGLNKDIKWALDWVNDVPDVTVDLCWAPLAGAITSNYKYRTRIAGQFALSSAAFIVEHPDKTNDKVAQYLAGVEGSLQVYKAILKSDPDAKSEDLDELLQKQKDGKLEEFVRKASKDCEAQPDRQS
jgi:hypothetical protein